MAELGRRSPDLRVRIVYSRGDFDPSTGGYRPSEAITVETLVEQARGSTDPVVLSLLVDRCSDDLRKAGRCDAVGLARRWTVADTQNQLAWVALSTALANAGDVDAARDAFRRAAQVSQWHEYYPEVGRLLESVAPKGGGPAGRVAVLSKSFLALPYGPYQTINKRCKEAASSDACGRILETMSRDGQSLMTIHVAAGLATARGTLPAASVAVLQERSDAMRWAALSSVGRIEENPTTEAEAERSTSYLEALINRGEVAMFHRYLQDARISENEAARSYVATLSAEQLARRVYPPVKSGTSKN